MKINKRQLKRIVQQQTQKFMINESIGADILDLASRPMGVSLDELMEKFGAEAFDEIDRMEEQGTVFLDDQEGVVYASGSKPSAGLDPAVRNYMGESKMKLTKHQLKKIIRESMLLREGHVELEGRLIFAEITEKMEHDLLYNIQGKIQRAYNDPSGDGVDLGALADDMGYVELMEQVADWFSKYIDACESRYLS